MLWMETCRGRSGRKKFLLRDLEVAALLKKLDLLDDIRRTRWRGSCSCI